MMVLWSIAAFSLRALSSTVIAGAHQASSSCPSLLQTRRARTQSSWSHSSATYEEDLYQLSEPNSHHTKGGETTPASNVVLAELNRTVINRSSESFREAGADTHVGTHLHSKKEVPFYFFGNFPKSESTFDPDGIGDHRLYPERVASHARDYGRTVNMAAQENPNYFTSEYIPAEWFEESASGGPKAAWRTRFPQVEQYKKVGLQTVPWLPDQNGRHQHTYRLPAAATSIARLVDLNKEKDASWFDESVENYDDFGRNKPPTRRSDRYYWDWEEKTWTKDIACRDPGCVANISLPTFDSKAFQHANCKLSFGVHATDYDDEYSREHVEWLYVNDVRIVKHCDPMAKGCDKSANKEDRGLHSCLSEFPIDDLLANSSTLKIAGKISEMVDECPVDNNLFSGVVRVSCFVRPKPPEGDGDLEGGVGGLPLPHNCRTRAEIRCHERGCIAEGHVRPCLSPTENQKCTLNMSIWQTDFDGDHGSVEVVEWIQVNGENVTTNVKPGRNPCKEVMLEGKAPVNASGAHLVADYNLDYEGLDRQTRAMMARVPGENSIEVPCRRRILASRRHSSHLQSRQESHRTADYSRQEFHRADRRGPIPFEDYHHLRAAPDEMYEIIPSQDVTEQIRDRGEIFIQGKISQMVDECGKDGYLFNAVAEVQCK